MSDIRCPKCGFQLAVCQGNTVQFKKGDYNGAVEGGTRFTSVCRRCGYHVEVALPLGHS